MKKSNLFLIALLIISNISFAFDDIDYNSFEGKAIKSLTEKNILTPLFDNKSNFEGNKNFSRYEIATILYNSIIYNENYIKKNANIQDITILKALVSEYANELGKLGATDYELNQKIDTLKIELNQKIDNNYNELKSMIDRVRFNAELEINKNFTSNNSTLDIDGRASILTKFNNYLNSTFTFDPNYGLANYDIHLSDDTLKIVMFKNIYEESDNEYYSNKKLPSFNSNFNILNGDKIENNDGYIIESTLLNKKYTTLFSTTSYGELFGVEWGGVFGYFNNKEGTKSNYNLMYTRLDNPINTTKKSFLSFNSDFNFTINNNTYTYFNVEYSTVSNKDYNSNSTNNEYILPMDDNSAIYLYSNTTKYLKDSKIDILFAGISTGKNYDITGLGDTDYQVFKQTDLIKSDINHYGGIKGISYTSPYLKTSLYHSTYVSNEINSSKEKELSFKNILKVNNNYNLTFDIINNNKDNDTTDSTLTLVNKTIYRPGITAKNVSGNNTFDKFTFGYIRNNDTNINSWELYGEHSKLYTNNKSMKFASKYYDDGDELYKQINLGWNFENNNVLSKPKTPESIPYNSDILIGGRYMNKKYSNSSSDEDNFILFYKQDLSKNNITYSFGGKYQLDRIESNGKMVDSDNNYKNNTKFSISMKYKFDNSNYLKLSYGPNDTYEDFDNFMYNYTTIYDNEQDQAKISFITKF
ncbi:hypothetical protein EV215_1396 [Hypnocyclicus thermotrophus]|uniref:SLH domain-containing protein n=1 Tax=Hypnocyclicus thermotrophus TaxID=1627895 RepID=A0AA46I5E2_9FUSO|nr:hypothetical protein [Hypnocyclicus thermotrophus]TDT69853.1 hypothetical protein EV215_1396 [Hypnocyclicus thermotrophus]